MAMQRAIKYMSLIELKLKKAIDMKAIEAVNNPHTNKYFMFILSEIAPILLREKA